MTPARRFQPSLSALRALEAFERLGSTTAAGETLGLTQSAISRQLTTLEQQLGVDLFVRNGRRMVLTPEARDYAIDMRAVLDRISHASMKLCLQPDGGQLTLAILPTFGMRWLVPRLADFAQLHPEVTINLSTRLKPVDFARDDVDAAIHFGDAERPGTQSLHLRSETVLPVCTPAYRDAHRVRSARDLAALSLLHIETRPEAWSAWFAAHGVSDLRATGMVYDQFSTITQAALHGLGVALLPQYLAEPELQAGRLCGLWGAPTQVPGAYHLIWPKTKSRHPALISFRNWIATRLDDEDLLPR